MPLFLLLVLGGGIALALSSGRRVRRPPTASEVFWARSQRFWNSHDRIVYPSERARIEAGQRQHDADLLQLSRDRLVEIEEALEREGS